MTVGWVYILTNPSMPGLVKIGFTVRNPSVRASELTRATGVPAPFIIAWCRAVSDCASVEAAVHRMLHDKRVTDRREFFRCNVATARQVIEAAAGAKLGHAFRPARRSRKPAWRRRRRGSDLVALIALAAVTLVLILLLLKPSLPRWLPSSMYQAFLAVENMG